MQGLILILITIAVIVSWLIAFMADVKQLDLVDRDAWGKFAVEITVIGVVGFILTVLGGTL